MMKKKSKKIKIVHIIFDLPRGGAETIILVLCKNFLKQYDSYEVRVLAFGDKESPFVAEFENSGIPVDCLWARNQNPVNRVVKIVNYLRKVKPDIVHTHLDYGDRYGLIGAFAAGVPVRITTIHNMHPEFSLQHKINNKIRSIFAAKIIAVSKSVADFCIRQKGMPESKVQVIYNAPSQELHTTMLPRAIKSDSTLKLVCIGNLLPVKGHLFAIHAVKKLISDGIMCTLDIYGRDRDDYANVLHSCIKELSLENIVTLKGPTSHTLETLLKYDLLLTLSLAEGLPLIALETMSIGLPIIASDIPPHQEIFNNGEYALLTQPNDSQKISNKVKYLINNPDEYQRLSEKGIQRAKMFSIKNMVENYEHLYSSLLPGS